MTVSSAWSGALTDTGFRVVAKTSATSARLAVANNPALTGSVYFGPVTPTAEDVATFDATGLAADTQHWWAVEEDGVLATSMVGRSHTVGAAGAPYSFTFAHATCGGGNTSYPVAGALAPTRVSDHPVFDDILAADPLFFIHGGDLHYYNAGDGLYVPDASVGTYRRAYDDVLAGRQGPLYRNVPLVYMWDDHCYGPDNADRTAPGRLAAAQAYRERVPHYPLGGGDTGTEGVYHAFEVGRVLFLVSDIRYYRDPPDQADPRTMMGAAQLSWMDGVLASSSAQMLCWVQGQSWTVAPAPGSASWGSYDAERSQIVQMLGDRGWLGKMFAVIGDSHAMAMDTGGGNPYGGFPIFMFSPLDSSMTPGPTLDLGRLGSTTGGARGQWGTVRIDDLGSLLRVTASGWRWSA